MKYLSAVCILWLVGCSATSQVPAERTTQTALDSLDGAATSYEARWQPKRLSAGTGSSTVAETIRLRCIGYRRVSAPRVSRRWPFPDPSATEAGEIARHYDHDLVGLRLRDGSFCNVR